MAVQKNKYPITHVLVDCENVGLSGLLEIVSKTDGQLLKFILFHNKDNKLNIPLSMVDDFCNAKSDGRVECVELSLPANMTKKQAENALDFYIAYYIGTILPFSPFNSRCVILSKDKDYDPLICHVQKDFPDRCERLESYEELKKSLGLCDAKKPVEKKPSTSAEINAENVLNRLKKSPKNRPAKKSTLITSMQSWAKPNGLKKKIAEQIIAELEKTGKIKILENDKLEYNLN